MLRQGRPRNRVHVPLAEWKVALFRLRAVRPSPVAIEWEQPADGYRIGVTNRGSGTLTECWLLIGGQGYKLGDVPPGGTLRRELPAARPAGEAGEAEGPQPEDVRFDERVREVLLRRSVFPDGEAQDPKTAFVIGWVRDEKPELRVEDPRVTAHHFKMFRVAIPLGAEEEDL